MKVSKVLDSRIYILDNSNFLVDKNKVYMHINKVKFKDLAKQEQNNIFIDFEKLSPKDLGKIIKKFWKAKQKYMLKKQSSAIIFANYILDFASFNFIVINYENTKDQNDFISLLKAICYEFSDETYKHILFTLTEQCYQEQIKPYSKSELKHFLNCSIIYNGFFNYFQKKRFFRILENYYKKDIKEPLSSIVRKVCI